MADKNNELDALMKLMLLKSLMGGDMKETEVEVVAAKVTVTPIGLSAHIEGSKKFFDDLPGGAEWFEETKSKLEPVLCKQTTKLADLVCDFLGVSMKKAPERKPFSEILKEIMGGGVRAITPKFKHLPAVVISGRQIANRIRRTFLWQHRTKII